MTYEGCGVRSLAGREGMQQKRHQPGVRPAPEGWCFLQVNEFHEAESDNTSIADTREKLLAKEEGKLHAVA